MPSYFPFLVLVTPFLIVVIVLLIPRVKSKIRKEQYYPTLGLMCLFVLVSTALSIWAMHGLNEAKDYSFNGIIEQAYYEKPKQIPHITIKGIKYDLGSLNYPDYDTILAGDSAIKQKGTLTFRLIKKQ
ncbi:hypothetical protein [Mucilaginibacter sp. SG564]|uniref:hypothetical protein n=1 Tax=Mucilaginibacter sp. SG564 TaxID=2587022 RepID=UPI0015518D45|nr:hypothetical protein [Mucilaginibacter sp. SG564]NOW95102.1 prepilin signal peptidase PulO-like enzyme (type II secretory pathway) [Mucilaginibacter sp. SG564]